MPIPGSVLGSVLPFGASAVGNLYPSLATLRPLTISEDSTGQETHAFADSVVTGQVNLPCRLSPPVLIRPQNQEAHQTQGMERFIANHQVNFQGYINVAEKLLATWQVSVDGVVFQIVGVEHDGSNVTSRLLVATINPVNP